MSIEILMGIAIPSIIGLAGGVMILAKKNVGVIVGGGLLLVAIVWLSSSISADESTSYVFAAGASALLFGLLGLTAVGIALKKRNVLKIVAGGLALCFALMAGNYFIDNNGTERLFGLFGSRENTLYAAAIATVILAVLGLTVLAAALKGRNIGTFLAAVALGGLAFTAGNYFIDNNGLDVFNIISIPTDGFSLGSKLQDVGDTVEEILESTDSG